MMLTPDDHHALTRLARYGVLRVGNGTDCVLRSVARKFHLTGYARQRAMDGRQYLELTPKGRVMALRTAT